jgi:hypothetical protein
MATWWSSLVPLIKVVLIFTSHIWKQYQLWYVWMFPISTCNKTTLN